MSNFTMPNGILVELFDYFHPEILDTCEIQCQLNPALMRLEPNIPRGLYFTIVGTTYECLYFLCLIAMCQKKFMKIICYRILFIIGIFDMLGLVASSLLPGYLLLSGRSFCQSPILNMWIGSWAFPGWAAYTALSISLAINRIVDSTWPNKQEQLFGGLKIIWWTGIPASYGLILYLKLSPMLYHVPTASYYFGADPAKAQAPPLYPVNNMAAAVLVLMLNILMLRAMFRISHTALTNTQRVIMIQCLGISTTGMCGGWLYVAMQWIVMPQFMVTAANLLWQLANGSLAIFYILVNKSMRGEVMKLLGVSSCRRPTIYTTASDQKIPTLQSNPDMGSA
ncbi:unnamed protein product, partial [Mesorhabditis belari]|uniref:G protein-coupled receptor n=1 Tax=Mesorhabditis belari TaxID=2138241 RepID=A0AAF3ENZ1_9BILA